MFRKPLTAYALFAGLTFLWMWPFSLHPDTMVPDVGDPLHLAYIMAWVVHQLPRDPLHLFQSNSFYPWPSSLAFADHLIPEAFLAAPVIWLTDNPALAYNFVVFLGLFLSAVGMRWLILEATGSAEAALIAGVVYAFNGFTIVETARVHVVQLQWWPLALVFLGRFSRNASWGNAFGLAVTLAVQGLSGSYYLVYSALMAPFWLGLGLYHDGQRPSAQAWKRIFTAAAVCAVPVLAVMVTYVMRGMPKSSVSRGVDLVAYLSPFFASPMWNWLLPGDPYGREFRGLLGLALTLVGLAALQKATGWSRPLGRIALATGLLGGLLSLGDRIHFAGIDIAPGPHQILTWVGYLQGLRHTPRFSVLVNLAAAILAGLGVAAWIARRGRPPAWLMALVVVALPAEHWRKTTYGMTLPPSDWWRATYSGLPAAPLADLPLFPPVQTRFWAAYPFASTYHWNPVAIGRTSFYPPAHQLLARLLLDFPDKRSVDILGQLGIRTLVIHPEVWTEEERDQKIAAVESIPGITQIRPPAAPAPENALQFGRERFYRLPEPAPLPPVCAPQDEVEAGAITVYGMSEETESGELKALLDRNPATKWTSGANQSGWYGFQVRLKKPRVLAAFSIETPPTGFPWVWPKVEVRSPGGAWTPLDAPPTASAAWEMLDALLRREGRARMVIRFEPREIRAFRLTFASFAEGPIYPFEVEELRAFGACR